jgi:benzylsuccinate CoA-transferase BbsE subunit
MPRMLRPFAGLRVLEIGDSVAAAYGARILADLGAEVIKLEPPGGRDANRSRGSYGRTQPLESALFGYLNHGKRSVALDLATTPGARLARDLAERCDLLVYEPQALAGEDAFDPAARDWPARPTTVAASPYGLAGARSAVPASPFVVQHASGFAFHQASPVHEPEATPPVAGADWEVSLAAGIVVALAAMWGLRSAQGTRPGPLIDLSTEDVLTYLLVEPFADWLDGAEVGRRRAAAGETTTIAGGLVWLLPCADGAVLVSPREDHQWQRWVAAMEGSDWAQDERLCGDREVRKANALALQRRMAQWSAQRSCHEIFAKAQEHRVACFPISTARDLLANAQLIDRRFFSRLALDDGRTIPVPGLPFVMTAADGQTLERGGEARVPALGEATHALLSTLLRRGPGDIEHLGRAGSL